LTRASYTTRRDVTGKTRCSRWVTDRDTWYFDTNKVKIDWRA
jgi:uncharacterized protein YneR